MIILKSPRELELIRQANQIVAETHLYLAEKITTGISTYEIDRLGEEFIRDRGAIPSFKGYRGYPASVCISINEEVVHGIPSKKRMVKEGDLVSLDIGAFYQGFHGDAARSIGVGKVVPEVQRLIETTEQSFYCGIDQALVGNRLSDISHAIQQFAEARGYSVVREYVGHGIGRKMHEAPQIPNFGLPGRGPLLKAGMTLAIEPMLNAGSYQVKVLNDRWTVVTADASLSAHYENTIAISADGPIILSKI
ncbi:MAG: type I methionyl aminopeptidase [Halanaerobiales bacterium]|nr:type I methionyl aminopeptidase [Halanaerobiales bacterium]